MRLGRLQINITPKLPKLDRKLELVEFFVFKDGTPIYTYKIEDLARISGRYLDEIKSTLSFMLQYAAGPEQVKAFAGNMKAKAREGIDGKVDRMEALIKIHEMADSMPRLQEYVKDLELKRWHDLVVMFTVLPGEDECYFSPKWNAKKIELIEQESDEVKELFFSLVESVTISFSDTYRQDMLASMVRERELVSLAESLQTLTSKVNTRSKSPDGQESASTSSEI